MAFLNEWKVERFLKLLFGEYLYIKRSIIFMWSISTIHQCQVKISSLIFLFSLWGEVTTIYKTVKEEEKYTIETRDCNGKVVKNLLLIGCTKCLLSWSEARSIHSFLQLLSACTKCRQPMRQIYILGYLPRNVNRWAKYYALVNYNYIEVKKNTRLFHRNHLQIDRILKFI